MSGSDKISSEHVEADVNVRLRSPDEGVRGYVASGATWLVYGFPDG